MSLLFISSPEHCANKGLNIKKLNKKILYGLSTFIFSIFSLLLFIYFILHPSNPQFYLKNTNLYQLTSLSNSTIDITLMSKNPNSHVGIYYDKLNVYTTYKGEEITDISELPPFYQGQGETSFLSTSMQGSGMTVSTSLGYEFGRDRSSGKLLLGVKLDGRLRWKVWFWVFGRYPLHVSCTVVISFRPGDNAGILSASAQGTQCSTDV
ncbi:NDR1/HIN1-like protein 26 [Dioscorea cayenensis subsp. rotundata]|uniref:NDR1/HIN1-like protein 26 n=1 Tax=Dioscorea cayennensis subsp. rotundata TaxID=55577 RepID=A0AB40CV29_DIOCR|nr:NDR1/HIN1-like protein 26 [Dioscorea cayenensis subsp. rotundata]